MPKGVFKLPNITNEPIKSYAPGSPERKELKSQINQLRSIVADVPMIIDGKEVRTGKLVDIRPPHDHHHLLGHYHQGDASHVQMAIDAALKAKPAWEKMSWESRAAIFLKAADLLAGPYRQRMNAVTMLGQSKNAFQAEIDCVAELADFFRFNVKNMYEIYHMQPNSAPGIWNRTVWRPLEGFVFALTPFNFTSIAGNLPGAPALMGNVCVWKPSKTAVYSAHLIMEILKEAGLPDGVINLVYCSGPTAADVIFSHKDFAGIHFTGSTQVFNDIWATIVKNIDKYRSYPRIVGETGGKDYIFADPTACPKEVATAIVRHRLEDGGGYVLFPTALVQDGLDIALGEHAAAACNGVDLLVLQGERVQLVHRHIHQGGHLVDEGARPAGAGAVHPLLQRAAEKDDLGVLAAQLDDGIGVRNVGVHRGGGGVHFLDEVQAGSLGHPQAGGAGDDQLDPLAAELARDGLQGLTGPLPGLGVVPLIGAEQQLVLFIQHHHFHRGGADVDTDAQTHKSRNSYRWDAIRTQNNHF